MEIDTFRPVIIPTLNRYDHLRKCVESLARCTYADKTDLIIGFDYPPSEKYVDGWEKIKAYLPTITGFKSVTILEESKNIGAANNGNKLRQYVKDLGYDAFIITEDDNVFSPNFLEYVNWGLTTFKDDKSILAICGFKRVDVSSLKNNVYKFPRFVAWGFGMWFDRREKLEQFRDAETQREFIRKCPMSAIFSDRIFGVSIIIGMLHAKQVYWDALPFMLPIEQQYCLFPKKSMVRNEGFDGSGIHGGNSEINRLIFHNAVIDTDLHFIPEMSEPLYVPELKKIYHKTYYNSFKERVKSVLRFLIFRFTGRFPF